MLTYIIYDINLFINKKLQLGYVYITLFIAILKYGCYMGDWLFNNLIKHQKQIHNITYLYQ